jgi:hypothetical protein
MKMIFGYDIVTYNGEIPNCLDPKFLLTVYDGGDFKFTDIKNTFIERFQCDTCVFNSGIFNNVSEKKSIYEIIKDKENGKTYEWFYMIEPHSGLDLFFGHHKVHSTFALKFMSKIAINEISKGKGKLLIHYTVDGGLGVNLSNFQMIVDFTKRNEIPDEKVYIIFSDFKLKENFKKLNVNYNVMDSNFYLPFKSNEFNSIVKRHTYLDLEKMSIVMPEDFINSIGSDKKDFLLLTRRAKLHRYFLLYKMYQLGLENNLVSWDKSFFRGDLSLKSEKYFKDDNFSKILETTSSYVDTEDIQNVSGYGFENKDIYLNTYISIVAESMFFQDEREPEKLSDFPTGFISEKIWKPIGHCQPFILAAPSKTLKYIKEEYGFKTFHPFIDESYDNENNDLKRIQMILHEIEKFSNKTKEEKIEFLNNVKDICLYNRELFLNFNEDGHYHSSKSLLRKMWNFLTDGKNKLI